MSDDDFAIENGQLVTRDTSVAFAGPAMPEVQRILDALGLGSLRHVTQVQLTITGSNEPLTVDIRKELTYGELRALTAELEEHPPTKKETP